MDDYLQMLSEITGPKGERLQINYDGNYFKISVGDWGYLTEILTKENLLQALIHITAEQHLHWRGL